MNLDIGKLLIPFSSAFSSISASSHTSWWESCIWLYNFIDKSHTASDSINYLFTSRLWIHVGSQPISSWIGQLNCMFFVLGTEKCENWSEGFMIICLISSFNDCKGEKWTLNSRVLPNNLIRLWNVFQLILQIVINVISGQRSDLSIRLHRISVFEFWKAFNEFSFELFIMLFDNDESFGREADLPTVCAPSSDSISYSFVDICINKNDEWIVTSKLHDWFLEVLSSLGSNDRTCSRASSEANTSDWIMRQHSINLIMGSQDILIFPTVESSLAHKLLDQFSQSRTAVRVSCE